MKKLIQEAKQTIESGEEGILATIVSRFGSAPRGAGSRMFVRKDGSIIGSIGGGAVEYQARETAVLAIKENRSRIKGFSLTRSQTADIGMICGGEVTVYFQYIHPSDKKFIVCCSLLLNALEQDEDSWLVMDITDEQVWQMGLYTRRTGFCCLDSPGDLQEAEKEKIFSCRAGIEEVFGRRYYIEPFVQAGMVYVFGGGHVAQELVFLLSHLGFRCIVMDDRKEFANTRIFPQAEKVIVGNLENISASVSIKNSDYVCIMTRGHQFDYLVQRQVMAAHPCYLGVMGSRNKIRAVSEKLLTDGFSQKEIDACHMPIGTAISAETPAEIAVSIAGELIAVRAERMGRKK